MYRKWERQAFDMAGPSRASTVDSFPPPRRGGAGRQSRFGPVEKARNPKGVLIKLLKFYAKEGKLLIFVTLLLTVSTIVLLTVPLYIKDAVNAISLLDGSNPAYDFVTSFALTIIMLYVFDWIFNTVQSLLMAGASQKIVRALRRELFDKMQRLPLSYHDLHFHGELMSRITNDIDNISSTIAASTSQLISALVSVIGSAAFMISLSPQLSLVTIVTLPMVVLLTKFLAGRSRPMFVGMLRELGQLNGMIEETIGGLRMVKAFNQERNTINDFAEVNERLLYHSKRAQIWSGFLMPFTNVISNLGFVFVSVVGGILAVSGAISVGVIASFVTYNRQFVRPLNEIAGMFNQLQAALAGAERVFDIMDEKEEKKDVEGACELSDPLGAVEFRDVCFSYIPEVEVLKRVSFNVKPGQTVALVGKTGAGKTTIVNLITRFYDATSGTILIDGKDVERYTRDSLRRAFTVVLQDTCLFTGTIADNIRYGKPDATMEEVIAASEAANSHPFIKRLPHGYDTMVSGAVDSLSQGQRQLIAIARSVLCSAPILILDEATSNVDTSTEFRIQEALLRFKKGKTCFVIAHRLSTIKDADLIFVVDDGRIIESGSHDELLSQKGVYAQMYLSQVAG